MRILFSQPMGQLLLPSVHIRMCYVEPLGLEYICAATQAAGHECKIAYPIETPEALRREVESWRPDVIAMSVYTYARDQALEWARCTKEALPRIKIVAGGYHPTSLPDDMLENGIDYVIRGEGEKSFVQLLQILAQGSDPSCVPGIAFARKGKTVLGPPPERVASLDTIPWPTRLPKVLSEARNYQVIYPAPSQQVSLAQVAYGRGCPNNCEYCSSVQMWQRKVAWRNPRLVLDEIAYLHDKFNSNVVYFPDLELNASPKKLHDLCDEFQKRHPSVSWWGLFSLSGMDDELLDHLNEAGCVKLSIGVEGVGDEAIRNFRGRNSLSWQTVKQRFEAARARGMITRVFVMIGNDWDTREYYEMCCQELPQLAADDLRVSFTTPFPGTRLYSRTLQAGTLETLDFSKYTSEEPILQNPTLKRDEILTWRQNIIDEFYGNNLYKQRVIQQVRRHPRFVLSYVEYLTQLIDKGGLSEWAAERISALISEISPYVSPLPGEETRNE